MDGLIIKKKWLDLIVSGKKTLEIRGSNTKKQNETIYLLESGTHRVTATAVISFTYPISYSNWADERDKHCVYITYADLRKDIKPLMRGYYQKSNLLRIYGITNTHKVR